ncbi:hypothetical protein HHI36_014846 [Cryptolaemus montrouzieri]|uniref:Uncharacterized protein n=1 Tax=Cryptolaemus montrouzieri TaxID=559131 RepID=A0ABD2N3Z4_9CUCU
MKIAGNVQPNENENENLDSPRVDDDDDAHHLLDLDKFNENIRKQRTEAFQCLERQAKRNEKSSDQIHHPVEKSTSVRIPVPAVDRGRVKA